MPLKQKNNSSKSRRLKQHFSSLETMDIKPQKEICIIMDDVISPRHTLWTTLLQHELMSVMHSIT
eukprot:m.140050 g.140050  ORF g.140050 m.140050 type:complete len:65 (-) comp14817_c2_seq1:1562-1756(-)